MTCVAVVVWVASYINARVYPPLYPKYADCPHFADLSDRICGAPKLYICLLTQIYLILRPYGDHCTTRHQKLCGQPKVCMYICCKNIQSLFTWSFKNVIYSIIIFILFKFANFLVHKIYESKDIWFGKLEEEKCLHHIWDFCLKTSSCVRRG